LSARDFDDQLAIRAYWGSKFVRPRRTPLALYGGILVVVGTTAALATIR
jgi:hypothetical protein